MAEGDKTPVESVAQFIEAVRGIAEMPGGIITFRGERDYRWEPKPGLMRVGNERLLANERDAVREIIAIHPAEYMPDETMFDRLVRMQHFGLPTRLLDITANPLVALFNATDTHDEKRKDVNGRVLYFKIPAAKKKYYDSDTVSCLSNLARLSNDEKEELNSNATLDAAKFNKLKSVDRLLQFIRVDKPYFRPEINPHDFFRFWYVVPKSSNPRIIEQRGAFLLYGLGINPPLGATRLDPIRYNSIYVSKGHKSSIREQLNTLGINESGLFPEIEKAAKYIARLLN